MFFLCLAIISSAMVSIVMRLGTRSRPQSIGMLAVNYLACVAVAAAYMGGGVPAWGESAGETLVMGLVMGGLYLLGFLLLQMNVRRNGVVLSSVFIKLGLLVPMLLSVVVFREVPAPLQLAGFLLALASIVLINLEKDTGTMQFRGGLILLLLAGGSCDAMSKVFEEIGDPARSEQFLFCAFLTAMLLSLCLMLRKKEKLTAADLLYGVLLGVPNYFSARFLLKALAVLPAVVVYPTYSVATVVLVTAAGIVFFRERLGKRQWIALGGILAALVLLNI